MGKIRGAIVVKHRQMRCGFCVEPVRVMSLREERELTSTDTLLWR